MPHPLQRRLLRRLRRPGIVYCSTKREVDLVYAILRRFDIPAHRYHGGMTSKERNTEQERFMHAELSGKRLLNALMYVGRARVVPRLRALFEAGFACETFAQHLTRLP